MLGRCFGCGVLAFVRCPLGTLLDFVYVQDLFVLMS